MCFGGLTQAFCVNGKSGNPSFILVGDARDQINERACCRLADRSACEVTWARPLADSNVYQPRYFVASGEIGFCGHGTLAAAAWLSSYHSTSTSIDFRVAERTISVTQIKPGYWSYPQQAFPIEPIEDNPTVLAIVDSLGLKNLNAACMNKIKAYRTRGAIREKLLVSFPEREYLQMIRVNEQLRDRICATLDATGIYAFCDISDVDSTSVAARHFPINSGTQEDMATGAIAPTVASHIARHRESALVNIFQGGKYTRNSHILLSASTSSTSWHVAGQCLATENTDLRKILAGD